MSSLVSQIISQITEQLNDSSIKEELCQHFCQTLQSKQSGLQALLEAHQCGDLTEEEFKLELEREKQIVEAEFLTEEIAVRAELKKLLDGAFSALCTAIV